MIVLDTDYLTLLEWRGSPTAAFIYRELSQRGEPHTTTIISYEEQMRGWMEYIAKSKTIAKQVEAYGYLNQNLQLFCGLQVLLFDESAAVKFQDLRRAKVRIGTMDLKIAAIALVHDATLLSRNISDFRQVPGLRAEDWIKK